MSHRRNPLTAWLAGYLARLRFPKLFLLAAFVFGVDLWVPDLIPFADEIFLGLGTALLGSWRRQREERKEARRITPSTARQAETTPRPPDPDR